jgi:hypothetical protein
MMNLKGKSWKFKLGLILIGISLIFFILLIVIPLLEIERAIKLTLSTISFVLAEVLFYTGGFLLGKEMFNKYKSYFNPRNWFKKKPAIAVVEEKINENDIKR